MNKRITSLMLVFTLILTMLATAVPALAAPPASSCTYSIEADKTSANPGDTINFTIYMQQTGKMNTLEGTLARQQAAPRNAILQHIHRIIRVTLPRSTLLSVLSVDMSLKRSSVIPTM